MDGSNISSVGVKIPYITLVNDAIRKADADEAGTSATKGNINLKIIPLIQTFNQNNPAARTKMENDFINVSCNVSCNVSLMTNEINEIFE